MDRIVIVGAGLAGGRAAVELRAQGFAGSIVLLGAEEHPPYDRPPLSKGVLSGRVEDTTLPFDLGGVEVQLGRRATGLRPGAVETDAGPVAYDGLVLATGAAPVTLPGDGPQRVLRTIDDARALRDVLKPGVRLVVVGAGWIGAEVATIAAKIGAEVTVIEAAASPLQVALGGEVGGQTIAWYAEAGVDLRLGVSVREIGPQALVLGDGEVLPADHVVVGVGVRPDTGWLAGSGLVVDRGVVVDEHLTASWDAGSDGPPVVVVGDCAAWWSRRYDRRLRVEHWDCAQGSPAVAATTLLGGEAVYDPVPYFWSEQFGRMVQVVGLAGAGDTRVWRGDPGAVAAPEAKRAPGWSVGWFAPDGRLSAIATVNRPMDAVAARRLIAADAVVDAERFTDLAIALKDLAPTA
ncbi:FAD-dependent oxidoreductase [Frankia sp. AiPs1]|uniref:NAD(P)/FAD-dependent oxidoreductase n=1 Tax=Frankia sp. AiPs1 TaxID=573493 RepID=UPI00204426DC|nr:FAD-dependent oxidoreductase [Frankia sp. AiPs1]MCM3923954.1 FAD-dependent oxidoreductase [Frankia sp. AiPs1]